MRNIILCMLLLICFYSAKADYNTIHDNGGRFVNDIQKVDDKYILFGQGDFLGYLDSNMNYVSIVDNKIDELATMSMKSLDGTYYFTKTYNNGTDAWIETTQDFVEFDTLNKGNAYDLYLDMIPSFNTFYIAGFNALTQAPFLYKIVGNNISNEAIAPANQIPIKLFKSHDDDICLLSTSAEKSSFTVYDSLLVKKKQYDFPYFGVTKIKENNSRYYIMSEYGAIIYLDLEKTDFYKVLWESSSVYGNADLQVINHDTIYACSSIAGTTGVLFRTTDGGESWEDVYILENERFNCFLIDANKAFIGTYSGKILYNDNFTSVQDWKVIEPNSLKVFPNPSTDYLTIDTKEEIDSFKIVDVLGNDVSSKVKLEGNTLDLSGLASGTYTLIIDGKTAQIAVNR